MLWYVKHLHVHTESRSLGSPVDRRSTFYKFHGRHVAVIFIVGIVIIIIVVVFVLVIGVGVVGVTVDIAIVIICPYMVYLRIL